MANPSPPCHPHGHTWAWVGTFGPKHGERCYCGGATWTRTSPRPKRYKLTVESDDYETLSAVMSLIERIDTLEPSWDVRSDQEME